VGDWRRCVEWLAVGSSHVTSLYHVAECVISREWNEIAERNEGTKSALIGFSCFECVFVQNILQNTILLKFAFIFPLSIIAFFPGFWFVGSSPPQRLFHTFIIVDYHFGYLRFLFFLFFISSLCFSLFLPSSNRLPPLLLLTLRSPMPMPSGSHWK
jgi:hypothetical protein